MSGCTGHCCEKFWLSYPLSKWREMAAAGIPANGSIGETLTIADMIIPLDDKPVETPKNGLKYLFTCRHWDKETRLCTNYDERPIICRQHPVDSPCPYSKGGSHSSNCTEPMTGEKH